MFSNLRINSQIFILHKEAKPYVEVGNVVSVTQPIPKFPVANFMQQQEMVVDVVVNINGKETTLQKLPANLDVADQGISGNLVVTTSKEAINAEIASLRQKSINILNSVDYHNRIIQECEQLLQDLNPEFAEQKQQKQEIDLLKGEIREMKALILQMAENSKKENTNK